MPALTPDIVLQQFNSRTDQLLLQAHARKLQTLRTITAKHLGASTTERNMCGPLLLTWPCVIDSALAAIASQCLGLVVELLPSVRASLMVGLPPSQHILLDDFTVVTKVGGYGACCRRVCLFHTY